MTPVFAWWFGLTLLTTLMVVVVLVGLVRHVLGLGRTLRRFQEEVTPISQEIAAEGDRAATRAAGLSTPRRGGRSG
jgi:hypothetical protein